jgi:hypothetical protein
VLTSPLLGQIALKNVTKEHPLVGDKLCHPCWDIIIEYFLYCYVSFLAIIFHFMMNQQKDLPHMVDIERDDPWT